jgi:carbonic anhydrase
MKLFEAILDANHRALAGDANAGLHPADYADELPIVALTCIDVRLNRLLPQVLGVPEDKFIWLRNAGNIITGPLSSTMRSLALACAVKGGRQIVILGHTDCAVGKLTTMELIDRFRAIGVERQRLPENITDYFGTFASEQANVIKAADLVRRSPLISPKMAVHGLLVNIETGRVDSLVDGYQALELLSAQAAPPPPRPGQPFDTMPPLPEFYPGDLKFPETKIGEAMSAPAASPPEPGPPPLARLAAPPPPAPPKLPLPPLIKPKMQLRRTPQ